MANAGDERALHHSAAQRLAHLGEAGGLAERAEARREIVERRLTEIEVGVVGEERAVDLPLLQPFEDGPGLGGARFRIRVRHCEEHPGNGTADGARGGSGVLIGQHHHRGAVVGKHQVFGGEARDLAAVLDHSVPALHPDEHAQPVVGADPAVEPDLGFHRLVRRRLQQALLDHCDIPLGQIARRHCQLAGREEPALPFLGRGMEWAQREAHVAGGVGLGEPAEVDVHGARHVERLEDVLLDELHERCAAHLLDDGAGDDEVGVAVLPLAAGREVERLLGPPIHNGLRGDRLEHERRHVVLGPVVLVAGGVRQQLADGDFVGPGEIGEVLGHLVVERELPLLLEQQHRRGGELLADRADAVAHLGGGGGLRLQLGVAVGLGVDQPAVADDGH